MAVSCPHCGSSVPPLSMLRLASGTTSSCRCSGCSRALGLGRSWERSYAIACWLTLGACFALSIREHSYAPYLGTLLVIALATLLAFHGAKLRVVLPRANWFPVVNAGVIGVFFCTLVYATPL